LITVRDLPAVNASLNATAALLLLWGYTLIRRKKIEVHRRVMLTAFGVSCAFLVSYLIYHANVGSVPFRKTGPIRTVYFTILLTHTVLAAAVAVMAPMTLFRALRGNFRLHRKLARVTFPIWVYVSLTGVVVYWMLYRM